MVSNSSNLIVDYHGLEKKEVKGGICVNEKNDRHYFGTGSDP